MPGCTYGGLPSSVGKFGGETDGGCGLAMGDFSMFRIYADTSEPAEYGADNTFEK